MIVVLLDIHNYIILQGTLCVYFLQIIVLSISILLIVTNVIHEMILELFISNVNYNINKIKIILSTNFGKKL